MKYPILLATLAAMFAAVCGAQTTVNGGRDYKGTLKASGSVSSVDFSGAGSTAPVKAGDLASRPAACTQGQVYFATDAVAGQNLYFCTTTGSPGTWSQMSSAAAPTTTAGSGAPSGACTPPAIYIDTMNQNLWFCSAANIWKTPAPDPSTSPTLSGTNSWTGYNNLSGAQWRPPESTVANLPAPAVNVGKVFMVTDAATAGSCSTGGGSAREMCRASSAGYECVGGCGSSGSGGGGVAPYITSLIAGPDSTKTISGASHGFASAALLVAVYDNALPRNAVAVGWTVNPSTYDLVITFGTPQSNYYVVVNGGVGPQGTNGTSGAGYRATSASALAIAQGSSSFTTQGGLAHSVGARTRASSAANGANYMEGLVTAYSGTTLTISVDTTGGSGTHSDWNLNLAGNVGMAGANGVNGSVYLATSVTSLAIVAGPMVLTTQSGLAYSAGTRMRAASTANGANYMEGLVTEYSATSLTVNVTSTGGSGTHADWSINLIGEPGQNGTGSGTVTGLSFSGGLISVANPTTAPTLTVGGTSGGIPYFPGSSTWASSGTLTSGQFVLGGGAGAAPATSFSMVPVANGGTSLGTLTAHALYAGNGTSAPNAVGLGTASQVLHGSASGDPTFGPVTGADIAPNTIGPAQMAAASTRRACIIENDTQSATALSGAQLSGHCVIPAAATIVEVDVLGGTGTLTGSAAAPIVGGTSSIQLGLYTPNGGISTTGVLSGALATAIGKACAMTSTSGTCINGTTSSSGVTINTASLGAGDVLYVSAATADGAQTWYNVTIFYTVN